MSNRECVLFLVVRFVKFRDLIIGIYNPSCSVGAWRGCEGSDKPLLNLAWSNIIGSAAAVAAIIVYIHIESLSGCLPEVCDIRNYVERVVGSQVVAGNGDAWS